MKNMVSCDAASKATMLSMGSLELLLRASIFTVHDLNEMGGTTLPREVLRASLPRLVMWLVIGVCLQLQWLPLKNPAPYPRPPSFHS